MRKLTASEITKVFSNVDRPSTYDVFKSLVRRGYEFYAPEPKLKLRVEDQDGVDFRNYGLSIENYFGYDFAKKKLLDSESTITEIKLTEVSGGQTYYITWTVE